MSGDGGGKINSVFYADTYHPIQAGSIDGTDIASHDNAVYRALLCYNAHLYDPFGDPKVIGDPYCTVFVGRISHQTTEDTLRKAMSKYGKVKNLRLVRHIVTGASRGYAFVEYETEKEMHRAYEYAHHSIIDDSEIIVDYNRQQLMPGWIPRRLGGGLGGKKESGQLRFGGREKPFRAPLRPIPFDDLKRLGIPPPPEGRYMSRFQIPSPPRRKRSSIEWDGLSSDREDRSYKHHGHNINHIREKSMSGDELSYERRSVDRHEAFQKHHKHRHSRQSELSISQDSSYDQRISVDGREHSHKHRERSVSQGHSYDERNPAGDKRHKHKQSRHHEKLERKHTSQDHSSDLKSYPNREERRHKHQGHSSRNSHQHEVV